MFVNMRKAGRIRKQEKVGIKSKERENVKKRKEKKKVTMSLRKEQT